MSFWKNFFKWLYGSGNSNPTPTPTPEPEPPLPLDLQPKYYGVNVQGVFRSRLHETQDVQTIVDRVADVANRADAGSLRIPGGKPSHGFWIVGDGYGESAFAGFPAVDNPAVPYGEPNYFMLSLLVAAKLDIPVWITLHTFMNKEDIRSVLLMTKNEGVQIQGVSISNEPYAPEYVKVNLVEQEVANYPQMIQWLRELGYDGYIGVPILVGLNDPGREERAQWYNNLVLAAIPKADFHDPNKKLCLDIHPYFAPDDFSQFSPADYFDWFMEQVDEVYGEGTKLVITEWAKKNQHAFTEEVCSRVIDEYITKWAESYDDRIVATHYQVLGGIRTQGLYDFESETFNDRIDAFNP